MKRQTPIRIRTQGIPKLTNLYGYDIKGNDEAVCFFIDMMTKYCLVTAAFYDDMSGVPGICISTTERTPGYTENDAETEIEFPEMVGWEEHCSDVKRYTIAVALTYGKKAEAVNHAEGESCISGQG